MVILGFTDLHGDGALAARLSREIAAADLVLLAGDLTQFGGAEDARRVLDPFRRHNPNLLAIPGNCDHFEVEEYLRQEDLTLHARHIVRNGVAFLGMGGSLPCPGGGTPNEQPDAVFKDVLTKARAKIPEGLPWVLLAHQPPHGTVADRACLGRHVGSRGIREFIEQHHPLLCVCGHIHEGRGIDRIGETQVANPGPFRQGGYVYAEIADGRVSALEIRNFLQSRRE